MIVIVEGHDNSGKTTLATYLAKQLRACYVKVERPKRAVDLLAYQHILEVANQYSGWVVTDRHVAISEPIYGPICRGSHDLKPEDLRLCMDRMQAVIYCRPPDANVLGSMADRAQMEGVVENASKILLEYDRWFAEREVDSSPGFIAKYDYTHDKPEWALGWLQQYAKLHNL